MIADTELLTQWRDYFWRIYLYCSKNSKDNWACKHRNRAATLQMAIEILESKITPNKARPDDKNRINECANCKYLQYPESWNVAVMD